MYRTEGILSFWKGILPPVMAETPKRALKFVCFEQFKPLFMFGSPEATPTVKLQKNNVNLNNFFVCFCRHLH